MLFVSADRLWAAPRNGGEATPLTPAFTRMSRPVLSEDGGEVAFCAFDRGRPELFVLCLKSKEVRRITDDGFTKKLVGWKGRRIRFSSNLGTPFNLAFFLHEVEKDGTDLRKIDLGPVAFIREKLGASTGGSVLCRHEFFEASARKRYRGGTEGDLWIDRHGANAFEPILSNYGNLSHPHWIEDRVYFLSDQSGCGNVHSCDERGEDLRRHTEFSGFYARHLSTDGESLSFSRAGHLYELPLAEGSPKQLSIAVPREKAPPEVSFGVSRYVDSYSPSSAGLAVGSRGRALSLQEDWREWDEADSPATRFLRWHEPGRSLLGVQAAEAGYRFAVFSGAKEKTFLPWADFGRPLDIQSRPSPGFEVKHLKIALTNHRNELVLCRGSRCEIIAKDGFFPIEGFALSPCGRWLAYSLRSAPEVSQIFLHSLETKTSRLLVDDSLLNFSPAFSESGDTLYFLGSGAVPRGDSAQKNLSFPFSVQVMEISTADEAAKPAALAVPRGEYRGLRARDKTLFMMGRTEISQEKEFLFAFDLTKGKLDKVSEASDYQISADDESLAYRAGEKLFLVTGDDCREMPLAEAKAGIDLRKEFREVFQSAWRSQSELFWRPDMGGVDWNKVHADYAPLLESVSTRSELSDLVWEIFGELSHSHAFESYRDPECSVKEQGTKVAQSNHSLWLEKTRARVARDSGNQLGYVFIPDFTPNGYASFIKQYTKEYLKKGLVLDLRYCPGGNLSDIFLEKLALPRLGFSQGRWQGAGGRVYPAHSPPARLAALINEYTCSDAEVFTHAFKELGLGTVIGKRSWGGTVGFAGQVHTFEGGQSTQPQIAHCLSGIGFSLENHGATPDFEVEMPPQAYADGQDPQLGKAIELLLSAPQADT